MNFAATIARYADDPVRELIHGLEDRGAPPLPWVVRWSRDAREPVAAAYAASVDPFGLVMLLDHGGAFRHRVHPRTVAHRMRHALAGVGWQLHWRNRRSEVSLLWEVGSDHAAAAACAAIRFVVPTPPPLATFLAGARRGGER